MIKKDLKKKQQQKERQARSHSSSPRKDQTNIKSCQGTQKLVPSNRERKGANDAIQQHNRFGSLSDSSDDMELGKAPDRQRTNSNRSRSTENTHASSSNYRSVTPWVLNFPPCRGPGGSIPIGNVANLVSGNCPFWEERKGNTTRLPWVVTR